MAALKMFSRISSPRSILTAAFYTACWSHPRCWARATENRLPLNPSSCSFLKWEDECISPSSLQYSSLPQDSSPSLLDRDEWEELSCHTSQVGSTSSWGTEVPKALTPALPPSREVPAVNAAAKRRELLSPLTVKGSVLGWVKASVCQPQRLMKHRVHCPEQPEPPSMGQTSCTRLAGAANTAGQDTLGYSTTGKAHLLK